MPSSGTFCSSMFKGPAEPDVWSCGLLAAAAGLTATKTSVEEYGSALKAVVLRRVSPWVACSLRSALRRPRRQALWTHQQTRTSAPPAGPVPAAAADSASRSPAQDVCPGTNHRHRSAAEPWCNPASHHTPGVQVQPGWAANHNARAYQMRQLQQMRHMHVASARRGLHFTGELMYVTVSWNCRM